MMCAVLLIERHVNFGSLREKPGIKLTTSEPWNKRTARTFIYQIKNALTYYEDLKGTDVSNVTGSPRKVALITGANKGIGFEITRQLGHAGMTVLLGARNSKQGEASAAILRGEGIDVYTVPLDLLNKETISAAADWIASQYDRLHILVNNAAIVDGDDSLPSSADLDAVRRVFEVNCFGTLAVTKSMLPLIRKANAGRITKRLSYGL
jgi:NADP-dependent 3-hydroxy acid dehydrogenase YdfG